MNGTTNPQTPDDARVFSGIMQRYAKQYAAGAFATPTLKEIMEAPDRFHAVHGAGVVYAEKTLGNGSHRTDFTGRPYIFPPGFKVITHLARERGAVIPDLSWADAIFAYTEDRPLADQLKGQGRHVLFHRISAASELISCWGHTCSSQLNYSVEDWATATMVGTVRGSVGLFSDVELVDQWDDDFPYYSDGSWSAVSLRGFYPEDPRKGVKPAEMPRTWKAEHSADLLRTCEWTSLSYKTPHLMALVESLQSACGWKRLERVRLLKMGKGKLGRHTDITDASAGLADGQIARFHLPLVTHPDITMSVWDLEGERVDHHLPALTLWYLDARKPHTVFNPTDVGRVHLVIDVAADAKVRSLIAEHEL